MKFKDGWEKKLSKAELLHIVECYFKESDLREGAKACTYCRAIYNKSTIAPWQRGDTHGKH